MRTLLLALCASSAAAWSRPGAPRQPTKLYRVTNSAAEEIKEREELGLKYKKQHENTIDYTRPDLTSAEDTFDALAKMCGVPPAPDAELDFGGMVLAFEQLFNGNVPLDPEACDELMETLGCAEDDDLVTLQDWGLFHGKWQEASSMATYLDKAVAAKEQTEKEKELEKQMKDLREAHAQREQDWAQELAKAKMDQAQKSLSKAKLMSKDMAAEKKSRGKYFEERESAARAAAQYRSLEPGRWAEVTADVGGMRDALEEVRRRVWTPLCAPSALLDELGAERLKGVLLYGPPGCGKSYLAKRLAESLSRRPATVVSGPEVIDKYVGSSEAQLRDIFASPPQVPPRPGDAEDVAQIAENNELHVIVLDEFDSLARQRSDGKKSDTATRDSVVNQLLVLMDGIAGMPVPTFILALTNRRELIDSAILRPGRLEAHVEVPLPDVEGRAQIFKIHAEKMRESGRLKLDDADPFSDECTLENVDDASYDAWVQSVAEKTAGFSGAAMAAVVRAAVARALDRSVAADDVYACSVTGGDFDTAIEDVKASSILQEDNTVLVGAGISYLDQF